MEVEATYWAQLLLKIILAHPAVTVAIPATSKANYKVDKLKAGHSRLPEAALLERLAQDVI
jgi:aryl-alcohol dehydrogenase-like predicted oxidoreductase